MERKPTFLSSPWSLPLILLLAFGLRVYCAGEWSLWEDEETAVHFSQRLEKPFPRAFPLYFYMLSGLYQLTGVSVLAGRLLSATLGVAGIAALFVCFRKFVGREAALLGALLVSLSLGHLFWSQSIRYYILLFLFQLLSMYWFLSGFERNRWWELLLSNFALLLALATHFSGALLMPVFVAHLGLVVVTRQPGPGYNSRSYAAFGLPFLMIVAVFGWQFLHFRAALGGLVSTDQASSPIRVLIQTAAYFGVPVLALAALAPVLARDRVKPSVFQFLILAGGLPLLELTVIAELNLTIVTWYYAFFSLSALGLLAGLTLTSLHERGRRGLSGVLTFASVMGALPFLVGYYTTMHGDRPRWKEAAAYLRDVGGIRAEAPDNPPIYATVPGPVAYYLGVPPEETMGHRLVRPLRLFRPVGIQPKWFIVESGAVDPERLKWLRNRAELKATFEARTGPKDRSVLVYRESRSRMLP